VWLWSSLWAESLVHSLCPEDLFVAGTCAAEWYVWLEQLAICGTAAAGAIATVAFPSIVAPPKVTASVAACAYGLGVAVAIWVTWVGWLAGAVAILPLLVALGAGLATVLLFARRRNAV
jgi:hypothetical protein